MKRVLVTGDRHWDCAEIADTIVRSLKERYPEGVVVVHGAAYGVDMAFAGACDRLGVAHEPHPAAWTALGKGAGPVRNQEMVDSGIDFAIAVHRNMDASKGTRDCVKRCRDAGVTVWLVDGSGNPPARLPPFEDGRATFVSYPAVTCPVCDGPAVKTTRRETYSCPRCQVEFTRHAKR